MHGFWLSSISLFLAAQVFLSTLGLSVHSIYCLCKDQYSLSLVELSSDCHKHLEQQVTATMSCCTQNSCTIPDADKGNSSSLSHNCESKQVQYFKLHIPIGFVGLPSLKSAVDFVWSSPPKRSESFFPDPLHFNSAERGPPLIRPFGAFFRILLQSFRC